MGIEEDTGYDKHWVFYVSEELRKSTPETIITLYVN